MGRAPRSGAVGDGAPGSPRDGAQNLRGGGSVLGRRGEGALIWAARPWLPVAVIARGRGCPWPWLPVGFGSQPQGSGYEKRRTGTDRGHVFAVGRWTGGRWEKREGAKGG